MMILGKNERYYHSVWAPVQITFKLYDHLLHITESNKLKVRERHYTSLKSCMNLAEPHETLQ